MTFNDQDPPWFGEKIKAKIELKNRVYKECIKNGRPVDLYYLLQNLTSEISSYISKCKNDYFIRLGKKLCDPSRSIKTYWATLRTLWNGKKVPNIPPLLVNNELIIKFKVKANIFNRYFASQCTNIVPVHTKGDKQLIKNYLPVSLLPICRKLMEKLMFNSIFNFIDTRNMLSVHQSGFRPGDSCVHQLISIVHDIYNAFDANPSLEVRGVFLDISKVFDRVWHKGLLYKLKCMGIDGNF